MENENLAQQRLRLLVNDCESSSDTSRDEFESQRLTASDKEISETSDEESQPKRKSKKEKKIKPVSKMSIMNDQVRRVAVEGGDPVPEPFESPIQIDIVCWFPALYISTSLGALIFIVCFVDMLGLQGEACNEDMRGWGYFLLSLVLVAMILSCTASCMLCFDACTRRRDSRF